MFFVSLHCDVIASFVSITTITEEQIKKEVDGLYLTHKIDFWNYSGY